MLKENLPVKNVRKSVIYRLFLLAYELHSTFDVTQLAINVIHNIFTFLAGVLFRLANKSIPTWASTE